MFLDRLFLLETRPAHSDARYTPYHEISTRTLKDLDMRALLEHLSRVNSSKRFFTTERGRFGFGRTDIQEGDLVCVLLGGRDPYILREEEDYYVLVGNCFCRGLMLGEAVEGLEEGKVKLDEFVIH